MFRINIILCNHGLNIPQKEIQLIAVCGEDEEDNWITTVKLELPTVDFKGSVNLPVCEV